MKLTPTVFKFRNKHKRRIKNYIDDNGKVKDRDVTIDLPVQITIPARFKITKKPSKISKTIHIQSPQSGDELIIDWQKALDTRAEFGEGEKKRGGPTIQDEVEAFMILQSLWPKLIAQIKNKEIGGIVALRKQHVLVALQDQYPDMNPYVEREIEGFDPVTDRRLHGITIKYGNPDLATELEQFPRDRDILTRLGCKTDYGRHAIVKATEVPKDRFMKLWKDSVETIKALDKFKKTKLVQLERQRSDARGHIQNIFGDMIIVAKNKIKAERAEQRQWQDSMLDKIWAVMFPGQIRPRSGWEYEGGSFNVPQRTSKVHTDPGGEDREVIFAPESFVK